jgi:uncharacterized membrane protein YdjX (TVP38/TMEM64 family)
MFRVLLLLGLFAAVLGLGLATDVFETVTPRGVHEWVRRAGVWAPAAYLAGFLLRPLTLVPLTLWLVVGGVAFGWLWGAAYALLGVNIGAAAVFLTARGLGRDALERLLGRLRRGREPRGVWGTRLVLSLQLFPFMPHDLLNAAAGCSSMSYWRFLVGSALGTLPFIVLYTYAGSVLAAPGSPQFFVAFAALATLSVLSLAASRRSQQEGGGSGEAAASGGVGADPAAGAGRDPGFSVWGELR